MPLVPRINFIAVLCRDPTSLIHHTYITLPSALCNLWACVPLLFLPLASAFWISFTHSLIFTLLAFLSPMVLDRSTFCQGNNNNTCECEHFYPQADGSLHCWKCNHGISQHSRSMLLPASNLPSMMNNSAAISLVMDIFHDVSGCNQEPAI